MSGDPLSCPLIDIARELRDRRASARELVDAAIARHERVERDKPYWVIFDRELQVALGRQVAGVPKSLAQRLSGIMIAGNHEDRHRQGCQQMAQLFVFVRLAVIDEIAGHDGDIGPWHQRV